MKGRVAVARAVKFASLVTDPLGGRRPGPRVLIYHDIGGGTDKELDLPMATFAAQIQWLLGKGQVVGLAEALSRMADPSSSNLYALTFDDGYEGLWLKAYPLLLELGVPFTLFVTTEPIETKRPLFGDSRNLPLTWSQVEAMMGSGLMTIGAHTHSHPDLRWLTEGEIAHEVEHSNQLIELRTGHRPRHFAYPWGYWTPRAQRLVSESYSSAALGSGPPGDGLDEGRFHRIPVLASDTTVIFHRRMYGGFRLENKLRRLVKGYRGP